MTRAFLPVLLFAAVAAAAYAPAPPPAGERPVAPADTERWAWPENPENLQVLPDDIGGDRLRDVMRAFTSALGVRCSYCHVGEGDFLNWDFASDANPHKEVAREMMRMTHTINFDLLDDIEGLHAELNPEAGPAGMLVTCWTCHRGSTTPAVMAPPEEGDQPAPPPTPAPGGHEHPPGQQHQH